MIPRQAFTLRSKVADFHLASSYDLFTVCLEGIVFSWLNLYFVHSLPSLYITRHLLFLIAKACITEKPVLSGHSKIDKTKVIMENDRLIKVESIAECSNGNILQYFRPPLIGIENSFLCSF